MTNEHPPRSGGRILIDSLRIHDVDRVFCIPGESYLDVLNALYDTPEIDVVVGRHEGAAATMAEADGRLTGRPGICFVSRGPGATHASIGVHAAMESSTPMVLFVGQVPRAFIDRGAFQEVDHRQMFGPLAKWVAQIDDPARIPEYVSRAFQVATSGRPGPVVLSLPEDMLEQMARVSDANTFASIQSAPADSDVMLLGSELARAQRPLLIVGGSGWTPKACSDLRTFAESSGLPVATSFRRQDLFDNTHPNYAGHVGLGIDSRLAESVRAADLLVVIGSRLGDATSGGYTLIEAAPRPTQRLVHVHPDPGELGRVYQGTLLINSSMPAFAAALASVTPAGNPQWRAWVERLHGDVDAYGHVTAPAERHRGVHLATIVSGLNNTLPSDAIVCNGAGNFTLWVHRFYRYRQFRTELGPIGGGMGYGVPAAIAAKLRHPDRTVVCFSGDGCFLMYPQELATAAQCGAAIVVLVVNNGMYGTIRMHQERRYPGRAAYTQLANPDFVALARAFGAHAERVTRTEDFEAAFARASSARVPALLELCVDPDQITPSTRLAS